KQSHCLAKAEDPSARKNRYVIDYSQGVSGGKQNVGISQSVTILPRPLGLRRAQPTPRLASERQAAGSNLGSNGWSEPNLRARLRLRHEPLPPSFTWRAYPRERRN